MRIDQSIKVICYNYSMTSHEIIRVRKIIFFFHQHKCHAGHLGQNVWNCVKKKIFNYVKEHKIYSKKIYCNLLFFS